MIQTKSNGTASHIQPMSMDLTNNRAFKLSHNAKLYDEDKHKNCTYPVICSFTFQDEQYSFYGIFNPVINQDSDVYVYEGSVRCNAGVIDFNGDTEPFDNHNRNVIQGLFAAIQELNEDNSGYFEDTLLDSVGYIRDVKNVNIRRSRNGKVTKLDSTTVHKLTIMMDNNNNTYKFYLDPKQRNGIKSMSADGDLL